MLLTQGGQSYAGVCGYSIRSYCIDCLCYLCTLYLPILLFAHSFFSDVQLKDLTPLLDPSRPTGLDYYPLTKPGERFPVNDPALQPRLSPRPDDDAIFLQGVCVNAWLRTGTAGSLPGNYILLIYYVVHIIMHTTHSYPMIPKVCLKA